MGLFGIPELVIGCLSRTNKARSVIVAGVTQVRALSGLMRMSQVVLLRFQKFSALDVFGYHNAPTVAVDVASVVSSHGRQGALRQWAGVP